MGLGEGSEGGEETGERWRVGDLVQMYDSHFKYHMKRISMYIRKISFISVGLGNFRYGQVNICNQGMPNTHKCT